MATPEGSHFFSFHVLTVHLLMIHEIHLLKNKKTVREPRVIKENLRGTNGQVQIKNTIQEEFVDMVCIK